MEEGTEEMKNRRQNLSIMFRERKFNVNVKK
jgi:hypothetical protein